MRNSVIYLYTDDNQDGYVQPSDGSECHPFTAVRAYVTSCRAWIELQTKDDKAEVILINYLQKLFSHWLIIYRSPIPTNYLHKSYFHWYNYWQKLYSHWLIIYRSRFSTDDLWGIWALYWKVITTVNHPYKKSNIS